MNVFITNPTDAPIDVSAWVGVRSEHEVRATIPARTTGALTLPRCVPCEFGAEYPPPHLKVFVEADGQFLASVSTVDDSWAVFALADEAR